MKISLRIIITLIISSLIFSCAGYRRGIESVISEETLKSPQQEINRKAVHAGWGRFEERFELSDISLGFYLYNKEHTHHSLWFLFIPYYWQIKKDDPVKHNKITIYIKVKKKGYSFNYKKISLYINDRKYNPEKLISIYKLGEKNENSDTYKIEETNTQYSFTIAFNIQIPSPDNLIKLDLSDAIEGKNKKKIPLIIFEKGFWSYWYT